MKDFVITHCHSSLGSLKDGLSDIDELFDRVKQYEQKAVALTDHGYLSGWFNAFNAYKRTGVKFLPGCEIYFVNSYNPISEEGKKKKFEKRKHLTLLCKNEEGYKNLLKMNFAGFQNFQMAMGKVFPCIDWKNLKKYSKGIIATTGCSNSPVNVLLREGKYEEASKTVEKLANIFDDLFVEIHAHHIHLEDITLPIKQKELNDALIQISRKLGLPLMGATDTHYLDKRSAEYHDVMLAVNAKKPIDDPDRHRYGIDEFYVKSGDEVYNFFNRHYGKYVADEAVENTVKIAEMCEAPDYMEPKGNYLPIFPVKDELDYENFLKWRQDWEEKGKISSSIKEDAAYMRYKCFEGFRQKCKDFNTEKKKIYWKRLLKELKVLEGNNFSSYMLIVADFVAWAKKNRIMVGCGRGSVSGCLVAYLLGIHTVDPIKYNLLFERFQNAQKKSLPDIDIDFLSSGRDLVKNYVKNKYGLDKCAQVSNINKYSPKSVIPDLVKSMRNVLPELIPDGDNYFKVSEKIKKTIPDEDEFGDRITSLKDAMRLSPGLRKLAQKAPKLMEIADAIVGNPRDYSTHAAGMVIADRPIVEFAPLRLDKDRTVAVQYDKDTCEEIGLIKMDFLGLSTLDVIQETFNNIRKLGYENVPNFLEDIPLDDEKTYETIQKGLTRCVFQLGKTGTTIALCKHIKPTCIEDIAIVNALARPSSKVKNERTGRNERQEFVGRRKGTIKVSYDLPALEKALKDTYGLCLYEEQLASVAYYVAGWDLNKADTLRKITKAKEKGKDLLLKTEAEFCKDAMEYSKINYETAMYIWRMYIESFGGYGFNKCLDINNYILSANKDWIALKDLKMGENILSYDKSKNNFITTKIKDLGQTDRYMDVWEVKFRNGGIALITPNHKLMTTEGYVELKDIIKRALPIKIKNIKNVKWLDRTDNEIGNLYNFIKNDNDTYKNLSQKYNISISKVKTVKMGKIWNYRQGFTSNNIFKKINSDEEAYWLGFCLADIHSGMKYDTSLSLASYDIDHIIKFSNFLDIKCPSFLLRERENSRSIVINLNKDIGDKLKFLGIPYNKNKSKIKIPDIKPEFIKHFILGIFDGDGTICVHKYKGPRIKWGIKGQKHILEYIKNHLEENIDLSNVKVRKDENSYILVYQSKNDVYNICNYLYSNAKIFLPRKRIRVERFFNGKEDYHPAHYLYRDDAPEGYTTIKNIRILGKRPTYYIETDHHTHNYILDGGVVSANSHSVSYSILGYITAYLKTHYPVAFLAAYLAERSSQGGVNKEDEIAAAKEECRRLNIKILPPDINRSGGNYEVLDKNTIVMGFAAIKGLGQKAIAEVVNNQSYSSLIEFIHKTDGRIVNKTRLEVLAKAGCFDSFSIPRKVIVENGKAIRDKLNTFLRKNDGYSVDEFPLNLPNEEWSRKELLAFEREVLGELVSGSLTDLYPNFFSNSDEFLYVSDLKRLPDREHIQMELLVKNKSKEFKISQGKYKGKPMIKYLVEDVRGGQTEMTVAPFWPEVFRQAEKIKDGTPIRGIFQVSEFNNIKTVMLKEIEELREII